MLLFVDNLTNLDFSYLHAERGMLGETWFASIELEGELDAQGMVCDFGIVKATARQWLDNIIDHRLLVPALADNLSHNDADGAAELHWRLPNDQALVHRSPRQCVTLVEVDEITPEKVAHWCAQALQSQLPNTIQQLRLRFAPEPIQTSFYHYSHGLKKHAGKCQRIAHGHRSKIEIWRDGESMPHLERRWAEKFHDIYIGSREDVIEATKNEHVNFQYHAYEGEFFLQIPEHQCYLIDTDSTVEFIAQHIAENLKSAEPHCQFRVKAYEGHAKGAVVTL